MAQPRLINSGKPAMVAVATILKTARTYRYPGSALGPLDLRPGTVWSGNKMLVQASPMTVYFTVDDRLYEATTSDFVRTEWMNAESKGARSAKVWCVIAEVEMGVLCELIAPWYLLFGLSCAKFGLFFSENKETFLQALRVAPTAISLLLYVRTKYPTLFKVLLVKGSWETLTELRDGSPASREQVASFIAELLKDMAESPEITLAHITEVLVKTSLMNAAKIAAKNFGNAGLRVTQRRGEEFRLFVARSGYRVTLIEANNITSEVSSDPFASHKLKELEGALRGLLPLLDKLNSESEN
jgi:hypothetical protein